MKRILGYILLIVLTVGIGLASGAGIYCSFDHCVVDFGAQSSIANSTAYTLDRYYDQAGCEFATTGGDVKTLWIQYSLGGSNFANALDSIHNLDPGDSDTLKLDIRNRGARSVRVHGVANIAILNTVTPSCYFWK